MKLTLYSIVFTTMLFSCINSKKEIVSLEQNTIVFNDQISRDSVINYAKNYMGTPYLYAGNDPKKGFDCSGFVSYVFKHFNINLPRSSSGYKDLGVTLKPENFKIGDVLVFYGYQDSTVIGHLGIICEANGMQSKFIHASSGKVKSVTISELGSNQYTKRFYKCIDVLSDK